MDEGDVVDDVVDDDDGDDDDDDDVLGQDESDDLMRANVETVSYLLLIHSPFDNRMGTYL